MLYYQTKLEETLTRREQVAKLAERSLMEVICATATRTEFAAMVKSPEYVGRITGM